MDKILQYDSAVYADVMDERRREWCRAFFRLGLFCENVENNYVESFYATIFKGRGKPFIPMVESIRRLALVRIASRSVFTLDHKGLCTPYADDFLPSKHEIAVEYLVFRSTNNMYKVIRSSCSYRVNKERRTCTCRTFYLCGIPCGHAYAAIINIRLELQDFLSHCFNTTTWRRTYKSGLVSLRGPAFWPSTDGANVHQPPPHAMPRRKKKNATEMRKRGVNESPTKKKHTNKWTMHYKKYGQLRHNSRFHKEPITQASQGESKQGDPTQRQLAQLSLEDDV